MIKRILSVIALGLSFLAMTGCDTVDINASSTQTAYLYKNDINESVRYNAGSDYIFQYPFEANYKVLYMDYSRSSSNFSANYTLKTKDKISVDVAATVYFELKRNPKDNGNLEYKNDEYVQFFTKRIKPVENGTNHMISPTQAYAALMKEAEKTAFRIAFTNPKYSTFEAIEDNIEEIRADIKEKLVAAGNDVYINVVNVTINDIPVPPQIKDAREKALTLSQQEANQKKEIEMALRLQASEQVKRVRAALNDIYIDKMYSNNVNPTYMLIEAMKVAAEKGSLDIALSPSFMEHIDKEYQVSRDGVSPEDKALFDKLSNMSNEELHKMFTK